MPCAGQLVDFGSSAVKSNKQRGESSFCCNCQAELALFTIDDTPACGPTGPQARMTHNFSQEASFPVKIQQLNVEIEDIDTDFLLCGYSDYVMVTITQTASFGTIFQTKYVPLHLLW